MQPPVAPLSTRRLGGPDGLRVSAVGLGCMGMSEFYGPTVESESIRTLHLALDQGVTFFDTADMYGHGGNERLLGRALRGHRDDVVIATKLGIRRDGPRRWYDNSPDYIATAIEGSLQRLDTDHIDLYYVHRLDHVTPIEEVIGCLGELVLEGKVRYVGLCEASASDLHKAHAVHPITALQSEYSLWTRGLESESLPAARKLGVGIVPYSPLGRGMLAGRFSSKDGLAEDDFRRTNPRFSDANFSHNLQLTQTLGTMAEERGCSAGQLALAWVLAQGNDVVPIPGTKNPTFLTENVAAVTVTLSNAELARLDELFPLGAAAGARYTTDGLSGLPAGE